MFLQRNQNKHHSGVLSVQQRRFQEIITVKLSTIVGSVGRLMKEWDAEEARRRAERMKTGPVFTKGQTEQPMALPKGIAGKCPRSSVSFLRHLSCQCCIVGLSD